ncbi:hypothetical protein L596_012696 [Steinernema carpocapsae]|uniref:Uncharacterized protein n=1 Tax=Steinernema carpocapsae TaxID=34508 RepID=A0A4U5NYN2_STECR|nr:hypothetical protein L596_012696 [Steinernema carpocapsae]
MGTMRITGLSNPPSDDCSRMKETTNGNIGKMNSDNSENSDFKHHVVALILKCGGKLRLTVRVYFKVRLTICYPLYNFINTFKNFGKGQQPQKILTYDHNA